MFIAYGSRPAAYSHRWKEFVELERQGVEFIAPGVSFEASELVPEMTASVFPYCIIMPMKCVVQDISNNTGNKCFWREWYIDNVVELERKEVILVTHKLFQMVDSRLVWWFFIPILREYGPDHNRQQRCIHWSIVELISPWKLRSLRWILFWNC